MVLTAENYYSAEADKEYMSVSQFKDFAGTYGRVGCESTAMAKLKKEWAMKKTTPLLVGSYVDSYFEGTLPEFRKENPDIFTKTTGDLKAPFKKAEEVIARIERDPLFMQCLSGEKQVIMTGELFGTKWKIKMDSYIPDKVIVDLKVMASLNKSEYVKSLGYKLDFIRYWGYDIQGAIYQEIVYQNTGKRLPFYIAAASKEDEVNIEVIHITNNFLKDALSIVAYEMPRILRVKQGLEEPTRCEKCDCCKHTKVLKRPISLLDLVEEE